MSIQIKVSYEISPWRVPGFVVPVMNGKEGDGIPIGQIDPETLAALADDWRQRLFAMAGLADPTKPQPRTRKRRSTKADENAIPDPPRPAADAGPGDADGRGPRDDENHPEPADPFASKPDGVQI